MESAAKRKATSAASPENEGRPSKRQKVPGDADPVSETVNTTTAMGLKFVESLKAAKDKTGRPIATHFLSLPDKKQLPHYYEVIKLPISLETIEGKLNRGEYPTLAQVESDCKRLVNNAKSFNEKKTLIYEDAERLRKTASNWMVKNNPAYRDGNYSAVATPIPGEEALPPGKPIPRVSSTPKSSPVTKSESTERPRRAAAAAAAQAVTPMPSKLRHSASAAPEMDEDDDGGDESADFTGKTFQQAQEQIIREMIEYVEPDSGLQIFQPFVQLPSRSLKDYYQLIKNPMSLQAVQKKVRGVVGRNPPTGHTDLKSWDAFEQEASWIWINAREYNEDGSDIYNLATELEEHFKKRLAEARSKVEEPPQPKLRLNISGAAPTPVPKQQLKLKLRQSPGSDPNTPGARSSGTPGVIVDNESLLRQQRHVLQSMNGGGSPAPQFSGQRASSAQTGGSQTRTAGSPPAMNGIKSDVQSPALAAIKPASNASDTQSQRFSVPAQTPMVPPHTTSRPASGSPHPNGSFGQGAGYPQHQTPNYYAPPIVHHFENFRKVPLKSPSEALMPKITLSTHPALSLQKPWSFDVLANKQKTSYSATVMLPPTHSYIRIMPQVPIALTNLLYRIFVTVNGNKHYEVNRAPVTAGINGTGMTAGPEGGRKKGEPMYETKLVSGVNRIEIEIVAEKRKNKPEGKDTKEQVDVEKCTIFVHLPRSSGY